MKKYLFIFLIVFVQLTSFSQSLFLPSDTSIYQVAARGATLTPDTIFESQYNRYMRFMNDYGRRLQPSGNYRLMTNAYTQYYNNFNALSLITPPANAMNFGNWTDVGQNNTYAADIGLGQVNRVQVDYDDPTGKTIYITSFKGGIFKTTDGGLNWINFYTDYQLPITHVTDILLYKDLATGDKYLYTAVGGNWLLNAQCGFAGIWRYKINGINSVWTNVTGNLTCPTLLGGTASSVVNKILINPNNINEIYLATNHGVFYSCNFGCTPPNTSPCNQAGITWKKANLGSNIWGIAFDYSDPTYKSIYCSGNQIWHTSNTDITPFTSITNNLLPAESNLAFDNGGNTPNGWSNSFNFIDFNINITTNINRPNELYALLSCNNKAHTLKFDKTISNSNFPNNFTVLYTQNVPIHSPGIGFHGFKKLYTFFSV